MLSKTHHALVDGISGVDIMSVLFDTSAEPAAPADPGERWLPRPLPSGAQLLGEALVERATIPGELVRIGARGVPRPAAGRRGPCATPPSASAPWPGPGSTPRPPAPTTSRSARTAASPGCAPNLADVKAIKNELGGTVNDVVLATVAGALGRHLRRRGHNTDGLELKAMVPVSVRADVERGALGNRVAAMMAPLPVWCQEPVARLDIVREEMKGLKAGGQAVGAQVLTELSGFAPSTVMGQASRADGPPALLQPGGHERARPAVPALPAGRAHASTRSRWSRWPRTRASASRSVLRRPDQLRPRGRLRRDVGPRRPRRATSTSRSPSWPTRPASSSTAPESDPVQASACVRDRLARVRARPRARGAGAAPRRLHRARSQDAAAAVGCQEAADRQVDRVRGRRRPGASASPPGATGWTSSRLADALDVAEVRQATPDEVRAATGFAIGGVPPFGHDLPVVLDEALLEHERVWAAAGDRTASSAWTRASWRAAPGRASWTWAIRSG